MDGSVEAAIRGILIEEFGLPEGLVDSGQFVSEGGLDSFDYIRLVELLRERFRVEVDWHLIVPHDFESVPAIARMVAFSRAAI